MAAPPSIDVCIAALAVYANSASWNEHPAGGLTFVGPGKPDGHPADRAREALGEHRPDFDPFTLGLLDGVGQYAWMKDGVVYVGTTGTTLRVARRRILDERGYEDVPDPYYRLLRRPE